MTETPGQALAAVRYKEALEGVEWNGRVFLGPDGWADGCPWCCVRKNSKHQEDCTVKAALSLTPSRAEEQAKAMLEERDRYREVLNKIAREYDGCAYRHAEDAKKAIQGKNYVPPMD